jgi:hypothetical protein
MAREHDARIGELITELGGDPVRVCSVNCYNGRCRS